MMLTLEVSHQAAWRGQISSHPSALDPRTPGGPGVSPLPTPSGATGAPWDEDAFWGIRAGLPTRWQTAPGPAGEPAPALQDIYGR